MMGTHFLAIDLGASSGRAVVGTLQGARMGMREVHRFRTPMIAERNHLYWDIDTLWQEVQSCVEKALCMEPAIASVSVDSWGVDYVPLDIAGHAVRRPFSYRDMRTRGRLAGMLRTTSADALFATTGTQFLQFNTLAQILADVADDPASVARTTTRLFIADYVLYKLCGSVIAERTMASTSQLFNVSTLQWADDVIEAIGDTPARWPATISPGTVVGRISPHIAASNANGALTVIATCSHDTAAAVAAVPAADNSRWAFISSGTWSLVGAELMRPILTTEARTAGFSNEVGIDGTIRFLKNRTGLWVLEECVREWTDAGEHHSWDALLHEARHASSLGIVINLNEPEFLDRGKMIDKIDDACEHVGLREPANRGALVRLILESLADSYRQTLMELEALTGERYDVIHVVGGGARNHLLNQLTANACGRRVVAGPEEATVLGNLLLQARTLRALPAGISIRDSARQSAELTQFTPQSAPSARMAASSALYQQFYE